MFVFPGHFSIGLIMSKLTGLNSLLFILGSVLPDLDVIPYFFGMPYRQTHRTITHSAFMPLLLVFVSPIMALGTLVHIIVDLFTYPGVKLFYPFSKKEYFLVKGAFNKFDDLQSFLKNAVRNKRRMVLEFGTLFISLLLI